MSPESILNKAIEPELISLKGECLILKSNIQTILKIQFIIYLRIEYLFLEFTADNCTSLKCR